MDTVIVQALLLLLLLQHYHASFDALDIQEEPLKMLDKLMNLTQLPGAPKRSEERHVRMRNIFAAPLENLKGNLEEFVDILTPKNEEQYEFLDAALGKHFVFQHVTEKEKKRLIDAMVLKSVDKGSSIIKQGDKGEYLYVVQEGTVHFLVDGKDVGVGEKGVIFGELSLLYDCPTAASVMAATDCKLWRVSQSTFRRIKAAFALQNDDETRSIIKSIPFFKDLSDLYIHQLADSLFQIEFKKGDVLATKGQEGGTLFIIKEGWVQGTDISIGTTKFADICLGPGEYFGERAIVTGEPAVGNVACLTDGMAWIMSKDRFQRTVGRLNLDDLILKAQDKKYMVRNLRLNQSHEIERFAPAAWVTGATIQFSH